MTAVYVVLLPLRMPQYGVGKMRQPAYRAHTSGFVNAHASPMKCLHFAGKVTILCCPSVYTLQTKHSHFIHFTSCPATLGTNKKLGFALHSQIILYLCRKPETSPIGLPRRLSTGENARFICCCSSLQARNTALPT